MPSHSQSKSTVSPESAVTTETQSPSQAVSASSILQWIGTLRAASRHSPWQPLLDFDGVDALDVLLSPIYLTVLNTFRQGISASPSSSDALWLRARLQLYKFKMNWHDRKATKLSAPAAPVDILLWPRDITHTVILRPVMQTLRAKGVRCSLMACQSNTFIGLHERDPSALYSRALWPKVLREAHADGLRRAHALAAASWSVPAFPGLPDANLDQVVIETLVEMLPLVSEAVANARMALDRLQPKVLVVGNDLTTEGRAGCLVAALRGVPTAMFMHGSISADPMQARHLADQVLVYGDTHRQELLQQGVAPQRVVVCGAPNLDSRPRQTGQIHPLLQSRLGLKPGDPWILVATSGPGHRISHQHHQAIIHNLVKLCLAFPTLPVVVKLHRKDRLEYYRQGLQDCEAARLVIVSENARDFPRTIFEWLQGCSAVLTGASAVAVEAMLMDVPVVSMDFRNEIHDVDFIDAQATQHVNSVEGLIEAVRPLIACPTTPVRRDKVEAYLQSAFFALDGQSSARGAQSLIELIPKCRAR
jgi:UDP-N-acetylglucosamine 2-epimerase